MTAAALVFCPSSSDPAAPNLTPPPLILSPLGTSKFRAGARIDPDVNAPEGFGRPSGNNVQPPTNPATAGMSIDPPKAVRAFANSARPAGDKAAGLMSASGLSAAYTPTDP